MQSKTTGNESRTGKMEWGTPDASVIVRDGNAAHLTVGGGDLTHMDRFEFANQPEPTSYTAYLQRHRGDVYPLWEGLSPLAKSGFLTVMHDGISFGAATFVMRNRHLDRYGGAEGLGARLGYLRYRGVFGLADYFSSVPRDQKLFSQNVLRINSLIAEMDALIWLHDHTDVTKMEIGSPMQVPWESLNNAQRKYLQGLFPELGKAGGWKDFRQKYGTINPDAVVTDSRGSVRLIEVKTAMDGKLDITAKAHTAKYCAQIIRMGLVVKQGLGCEGIEVVLMGQQASKSFVASLVAALQLTEVPWLLRLQTPSGEQVVVRNANQVLRYGILTNPESWQWRAVELAFPSLIPAQLKDIESAISPADVSDFFKTNRPIVPRQDLFVAPPRPDIVLPRFADMIAPVSTVSIEPEPPLLGDPTTLIPESPETVPELLTVGGDAFASMTAPLATTLMAKLLV